MKKKYVLIEERENPIVTVTLALWLLCKGAWYIVSAIGRAIVVVWKFSVEQVKALKKDHASNQS